MVFGSVTRARSNRLSETVVVYTRVLENLVLLIDLVTLDKERKKTVTLSLPGTWRNAAPHGRYLLQSQVPFRSFIRRCYVPFRHTILSWPYDVGGVYAATLGVTRSKK